MLGPRVRLARDLLLAGRQRMTEEEDLEAIAAAFLPPPPPPPLDWADPLGDLQRWREWLRGYGPGTAGRSNHARNARAIRGSRPSFVIIDEATMPQWSKPSPVIMDEVGHWPPNRWIKELLTFNKPNHWLIDLCCESPLGIASRSQEAPAPLQGFTLEV